MLGHIDGLVRRAKDAKYRVLCITVDLAVNTLTLIVQLFVTGRIIVCFGVALALGFLPALTMLGFGALAVAPTLSAIAIFQVVRRASDYAIARPTPSSLRYIAAVSIDR